MRSEVRSSPFIPAAVFPPSRDPGLIRALRFLRDNAIEGWPRAVYEQRAYQVPWKPPQILLSDPEAIGQVLLEREKDFPHGEMFARFLRPVWGDGLLTAEGAHWRWQRRAAAPAFRPKQVATLVPQMTRAAEATLDDWRAAGDGARIDVAAAMTETTLKVILETMLSGGRDFPDLPEARRQIAAFVERIGRMGVADFLPVPGWLRRSAEARGGPPAAYMRRVVGAMVARRRREGLGRGDLVDMLMTATDPESGQQMDDVVLRDNLIGFIGAGHETTSLTLSWALYLIANDPITEARLLDEIRVVAGDAPIGPEHIPQLGFTSQVIQETMRLYPAAAALMRTAATDTELAGYEVRRGTLVIIPVYALHRHRMYWDDPDAFIPDRFAPERATERHRFQYLPFGAGPRVCIGAAFAMTEAVAILATIVRAVHLTPDPGHRVRPILRVTLRPEGGLPMAVHFRS